MFASPNLNSLNIPLFEIFDVLHLVVKLEVPEDEDLLGEHVLVLGDEGLLAAVQVDQDVHQVGLLVLDRDLLVLQHLRLHVPFVSLLLVLVRRRRRKRR